MLPVSVHATNRRMDVDVPVRAPAPPAYARRGFRWLSAATWVYAGSASASSASACFYALAGQAASVGDPITAPLGAAGSAAILAGVVLAVGSLILLVLASSRFKLAIRTGSPEAATLTQVRSLLALAYLLVAIAMSLAVPAFHPQRVRTIPGTVAFCARRGRRDRVPSRPRHPPLLPGLALPEKARRDRRFGLGPRHPPGRRSGRTAS